MTAACGLAASVALSSTAQADTDAFGDRVRAYLLENPEVILEALTILSEREAEAATVAKLSAYSEMFEARPILGMGAPDAPVRVIEFFDYKCVPCKAMHPRLEALVAEQPDLRIEMYHLPILTPGSERGARFTLAILKLHGAEVYARAHERLWAHRGAINHAVLERIATAEGLDFSTIEAEMAHPEITSRINRNRDMAIDLEILGTPAFVTPTHVSFGQGDVAALAERWLSQ